MRRSLPPSASAAAAAAASASADAAAAAADAGPRRTAARRTPWGAAAGRASPLRAAAPRVVAAAPLPRWRPGWPCLRGPGRLRAARAPLPQPALSQVVRGR